MKSRLQWLVPVVLSFSSVALTSPLAQPRPALRLKHVRTFLAISITLLVVMFHATTFSQERKLKGPIKIPRKDLIFRADIKQFAWNNSQLLPVKMMPVSEGICALTGVAGKFRGGGEQVFVRQGNGYWYLGGGTLQFDYLWAQAHCIPYKDFGANYANIRYTGTSDWLGCNTSTCGKQEVVAPYYGARKAVFLQGVSGDFEKPSRWNTPGIRTGHVTWQDGAYTRNSLGVSAWGRGILSEGGQNLFATMRGYVGSLGGNVPDMWDTNLPGFKTEGFTTPQNQDRSTGYKADSYFCTVAGVSGYFHGGGERVNLAIDSNREWIMQGQSMQGYTGLTAWCFRFR
jgi:hypothetical protein